MADVVTIFALEIVLESDKAILVRAEGEEVWIPKSQIVARGEDGHGVWIRVPEWLAHQKGLD